MKRLLLLLALCATLFAAPPVGIWEVDTDASLKLNEKADAKKRRMILAMAKEMATLNLAADHSATLGKDEGYSWNKLMGNSYALSMDSKAINFVLSGANELRIDMNEFFGFELVFVPEGTLKKAPRTLPKDFAYFDQTYRSELQQGSGTYKFIKLSSDGKVYQHYGTLGRTIDPALINDEMIGFFGEGDALSLDAELGTIVLRDGGVYLSIRAVGGREDYVLARYKNSNLSPASSLPWTLESVKAYTLKHPKQTYRRIGYDRATQRDINEDITYTITSYDKKHFDDPIGTIYRLDTPQDSGSLYRWSQFSPFAPNHVPKDRAEKITYSIEGVETISTPAGTFTCTVINLDADGEIIKAWMINDRPGVYAKYFNFMHHYTLLK